MRKRFGRISAALTILGSVAANGVSAEPPGGPTLAAREAGARHGQAMGVALLCYGLRTTSTVDRLASRFTGPDHTAFDEESDKVIAAWHAAGTCRRQGDPNVCRLTYEWSCSAAVREIGPAGSALPGLVEPKPPPLGPTGQKP